MRKLLFFIICNQCCLNIYAQKNNNEILRLIKNKIDATTKVEYNISFSYKALTREDTVHYFGKVGVEKSDESPIGFKYSICRDSVGGFEIIDNGHKQYTLMHFKKEAFTIVNNTYPKGNLVYDMIFKPLIESTYFNEKLLSKDFIKLSIDSNNQDYILNYQFDDSLNSKSNQVFLIDKKTFLPKFYEEHTIWSLSEQYEKLSIDNIIINGKLKIRTPKIPEYYKITVY